MLFEGTLQVQAPPAIVWDLITDPEAMVRYTPQVTLIHVLSGGGGVGASVYTMVTSAGRPVHCEQFT